MWKGVWSWDWRAYMMTQITAAYMTQLNAAYMTQITAAYMTQTTAAYMTQLNAVYMTQITAAYMTQTTAAYMTQITAAYMTQTTAAHVIQSNATYMMTQRTAYICIIRSQWVNTQYPGKVITIYKIQFSTFYLSLLVPRPFYWKYINSLLPIDMIRHHESLSSLVSAITCLVVLLSTSKVVCRHVEHNYRYHIDNVDKLSSNRFCAG